MSQSPNLRIGVIGGSREAADLISESAATFLLESEPLPDRFEADAVIDASHPCERRTPGEVAERCRAQNIPLLRLRRPMWPQTEADIWIGADTAEAARRALRPDWTRVLLCLGREDRDAFAEDTERWYLARTSETSKSAIPLFDFELTPKAGPFTVEGETELLRQERIDVVVARAAGGDGAIPKILAARKLGLPVIMLTRPPALGPEASSVAEALAWIEALPRP